MRLEELAGQFSRRRAVGRGDRILEVEDQRVGAGFETARELALAIGRNEQERAHWDLLDKLSCVPHYVYFLASRKHGTLYVGVTNDLVRRVHQHTSQSEMGGFTSKYHVTRLVWFETHDDVTAAIKREKEMKKWRREWKIGLIERDNLDWLDITESILK